MEIKIDIKDFFKSDFDAWVAVNSQKWNKYFICRHTCYYQKDNKEIVSILCLNDESRAMGVSESGRQNFVNRHHLWILPLMSKLIKIHIPNYQFVNNCFF